MQLNPTNLASDRHSFLLTSRYVRIRITDKAAKSCLELGAAGVRKSGQYWIDPDGPQGPIPAELKMCEFAPGETYVPGLDPAQTVGM